MRPYDERLEHLLARAARVFADKGYHCTTMRDLAAASGMSLAGMYYYVRGKEDLLCLIQERCFTEVFAGATQALARLGDADPLDRLLKEIAPDEAPVDRSAAGYLLFGMMNWIYNWYDPAGEIAPDRLAALMARTFRGGFAETRSPVHGG